NGRGAGDAEKEGVDRVLADRQIAVAQAGGDGLRPDRVAVRVGERVVARNDGRRGAAGAAGRKQLAAAGNVRGAEEPVKGELLQVVLVDLDEFRLDLDLDGARADRAFDDDV